MPTVGTKVSYLMKLEAVRRGGKVVGRHTVNMGGITLDEAHTAMVSIMKAMNGQLELSDSPYRVGVYDVATGQRQSVRQGVEE